MCSYLRKVLEKSLNSKASEEGVPYKTVILHCVSKHVSCLACYYFDIISIDGQVLRDNSCSILATIYTFSFSCTFTARLLLWK